MNVSLHRSNYSRSNEIKSKHKASLSVLPLNSIPYYPLFLKLVASLFIEEVPYIKAVEFFNGGNIPENFKRSSSYVYKPIPLKGIQIMQYFLSHAPNKDASI